MTRNEYTLRVAEMILADWRKVLLANAAHIHRISLPGDTIDISWRAMQKATKITDEFFEKEEPTPSSPQCCMCGKTGLSTAEDGGPECELHDGRWVCSHECYDRADPADNVGHRRS